MFQIFYVWLWKELILFIQMFQNNTNQNCDIFAQGYYIVRTIYRPMPDSHNNCNRSYKKTILVELQMQQTALFPLRCMKVCDMN